MTDTEFASLLRSQRSTTQREVDEKTRQADRDHLTPAERLAQFGK